MTNAEDARDEAQQLDELAALEEITRGGLPSHVQARIVLASRVDGSTMVGNVVEIHPAIPGCPVFFSRAGRTYPERCQLAAGHGNGAMNPRHFHGNIGWFLAEAVAA